MDATQWQEVERIFFEVVDLPPTEQEQHLEKVRQDHPAIYHEVQILLKEEQALHPMLKTEPSYGWQGWDDMDLVGQKIGPYKLASLLGSGGMGSVFLANRADGTFEQTVALKLMKEGIYNDETVKGFLQERQILAQLQHPHIARLLDGGVYREDRPFYTLEYIEGLPLDEYWETNELDLNARLKLFTQICEAVQYAHNQLILHLDLKPSNILVDHEGRVKLLDFGIARLLDQASLSADNGYQPERRYTLAYAAPEQLNLEVLTTASDTYSLGVLLFQMITGTHPFQEAMTERELLRSQILSQPAPAPSQKIQDAPKRIAIDADLDLICQKTLEKSPGQRYSSVQALQADIEAYIHNFPISLKKEQWGYVAQKYVRRNRSLVGLVGVALLTLMGITAWYTVQLQQERNVAQKEASKARQIANLLSGMFSQANPNISLGEELTASDLLEQGTLQFQQNLADSPELLAEMYQILGGVYMDRAEYGKADTLLSQALALQDSLSLSPTSARVLSYYQLGSLKYRSSDYEQARELFAKGLLLDQQLPTGSYSYRDDLQLEWGNMEGEVGNYQISDSLLYLSLAQNESGEPEADSMQAMIHLALGINARKLGKFEEAQGHYQKALDLRRELYPPNHPDIAHSLNHFASLYFDQRKFEEALPFAQESYEMRKAVFGEEHPETIASLSNLSRTHANLGNHQLARKNYEIIYGHLENIYGYPHHYLGAIRGNIANTFLKEGDTQTAILMFEEAMEILEESLPEDHIRLSTGYRNYGKALYKGEKYAASTAAFEEALRVAEVNLPEDHTDIALTEQGLGLSLLHTGENERGRVLLVHAQSILAQEPSTYAAELAQIAEGLGVMALSPETE